MKSLITTVLFFSVLFASGPHLFSETASEIESIDAVIINNEIVPGLEPLEPVKEDFPDLSNVQPMPFPEIDDNASKFIYTEKPELVGYQPDTKETFNLNSQFVSPEIHGSLRKSFSGIPQSDNDKAAESAAGQDLNFFSGLQWVSNQEQYPWRVNVKLIMNFPNGAQTGCSGTLIDDNHVITAGHCVHYASLGGWATSIQVIPAYEDGYQPYGYTWGSAWFTWQPWIDYKDHNYDMAIIRLQTNIGAVVGWHGYNFYYNICEMVNSYTNPGYPGAPFSNGERMFSRNGTFDFCDGLQVGSYDRSYHGQSGSGSYEIINGTRYVEAVLSNGTEVPPYWTRHVAITEAKFNDISSILGNGLSTFDLSPLNVSVSPTEIIRGQSLSNLTYYVYNSSVASKTATVNVGVYISGDSNISTSDTQIQQHSFTYTFNPQTLVQVNVIPPLVIPSGIRPGQYWVGVILQYPDWDNANNESDGSQAAVLNVLCESEPCTLFSDDFEDGELTSPYWLRKKGNWSVVSGQATGTVTSTGDLISPAFDSCPTCTFESNLRIGSGGRISLFAWYANSKNFVELRLMQDKQKILFVQKSGSSRTKKSIPYVLNADESYNLKIQYDGTLIHALVNDTPILTLVPIQTPTGGALKFKIKSPSRLPVTGRVEDVRVY